MILTPPSRPAPSRPVPPRPPPHTHTNTHIQLGRARCAGANRSHLHIKQSRRVLRRARLPGAGLRGRRVPPRLRRAPALRTTGRAHHSVLPAVVAGNVPGRAHAAALNVHDARADRLHGELAGRPAQRRAGRCDGGHVRVMLALRRRVLCARRARCAGAAARPRRDCVVRFFGRRGQRAARRH